MLYRFQKLSALNFLLIIIHTAGCLSLLNSSKSFGQQTESSDIDLKYWAHSGTSISTLGVGVHGGIIFDYNHHVFSFRTASTSRELGTETWDIALLYGRSMSYRTIYLSAAVGASVIGGKSYSRLFKRQNETQIETNTIGFPLEGQISWEPVNFVALGLYSFMNVNTEQPFGGIGLTLRVGNF